MFSYFTPARLRRVGGAGLSAVVLAGALAACGSEDDSDDTASAASPCTITMGYPAAADYALPGLMADKWNEFEDLGITVTTERVGGADTVVMLASGRIDAVFGPFSAGTYNAVADGSKISMVAPGATTAVSSKGGWWVSKKALKGKEYDPALFRGQKVITTTGTGSYMMGGLAKILEPAGLTINDVDIVQLAPEDVPIALINGSGFAGTPSAASGVPVLEKADAGQRVGYTYPEGMPGMVLMFGDRLLNKDRECGQKVVQATYNMYRDKLQGNYYQDDKLAPQIAAALEITVESLQSMAPAYEYNLDDFTFPEGFGESGEKVWRTIPGVLSYEGSIADKIVDDTLAKAVKK